MDTIDSPIRSAYADEQTKLDDQFTEELTVWLKIKAVLDEHSYTLESRLVDGLPEAVIMKSDTKIPPGISTDPLVGSLLRG